MYSDPQDALCYPVGDTKLVTSTSGAEVTSMSQLYIDGDVPITVKDSVVFEGEERPVLRISNYYRNGKVDLKVVFL